ncbi:MAG: SGNH/GDSL hydrolase family protein [Candidatus Aminicenantia bacterium]
MTRIKKFFLLIFLNLFLILIILYAFEFFLGIQDSKWESLARSNNKNKALIVNKEGWGVFNGKVVSNWGYPVIFNDLGIKGFFGFRQRQFEIPKPENVFRVIVLGDSFSWGIGMAEEKRYSNLIEKMLNSRYSFKKFEVINLSVLGICTLQQKEILLKTKEIVQPDLIIIGFCLNDTKPGPESYTLERANFERKFKPFFNSLSFYMGKIGFKRFPDFIKKSILKIAEILNIIPTWEEAVDRTYNKSSPEWNEFLRALIDIKKISDEMGLPPPIFAVLNHGTSTTRPTDYNNPDRELRLYLRWWHQAERAAKRRGFITCNMEDLIKKKLSKEPLAVNRFDLHPSSRLHEVYAEKIFPLVCDIIEKYNLKMDRK